MEVTKSLIAAGVTAALLAGYANLAMAKTTAEEDSVYQWGQWATLAPAAGEEAVLFAPAGTNNLGACESGENCPQITDAGGGNEDGGDGDGDDGGEGGGQAQSPCAAGAACGFARVDPADSASAGSYVASFALDMQDGDADSEDGGPDTVAFKVGQGGLLEPNTRAAIDSDTEDATYYNGGVRTSNRKAATVLRGDIELGEAPDETVVQGLWAYGADNGEFVSGIAATEDQLTTLANSLFDVQGTRVADYFGPLANGGDVALHIDLAPGGTWGGEFNGAVPFNVTNGRIVDAGFVTDAQTVFSGNIAAGEVAGALVNAGGNAIGGYEVVTLEGAKDADVFNAQLQRRPLE